MFSRSLAFATIPKACGFEAATISPSIQLCGSLIPIVVIGMGMVVWNVPVMLIGLLFRPRQEPEQQQRQNDAGTD